MYVRLAFSVAIHTDPDILIVDEVLAVGDEAFQRKCMDRIRSFQAEGRTIILVTHSMPQVAELCDRAVLLDHGRMVIDGDPNDAIMAFRDLLEVERLGELAARELRPDDPANARILDTKLFVNGQEAAVVTTGDAIVIESKVFHPTGIERWLCAVQIDSENGQVVFGTGSNHAPKDAGPLVGERVVRIEIPGLMLGGGKYFVSIALMDEAGRQLASAPQTVSFNVPAAQYSWGTVAATPVISFPEAR
jgi:ABC-2 type transport system ATP-binding protein